MTRPLCFLASRAEPAAADAEYASVLTHTGLGAEQLVRVRLEQGERPGALTEYAGLILGGSPFTVSTPEADKSSIQRDVEHALAELLDEVVAQDVPFLGLCYGIGVVGRWGGGVVDGRHAEDTAAVTISLTDEGLTDPLLVGMPAQFQAYVGHKEACTELPPGAVVLATSSACPVQMYRFAPRAYVTQFHPEMDAEAVRLRIEVYAHAGYFPPDEVAEVIERTARADVAPAHRVLRAFADLAAAAPPGLTGRDASPGTQPSR
ncbi:glutamine amidotransferase [Ruania albidiflava]|uniref:glutamine amidotransferase n=1 Tax=Ruania albidiflava TaxID=366586 RepID=UPI0003B3B733|nr:glutamine amidotransferase [Ruania albidiflava]